MRLRGPACNRWRCCPPARWMLAWRYPERYPGIGRLAVTSTTSVIAKASSPDLAERRQMAAILHGEGQLLSDWRSNASWP